MEVIDTYIGSDYAIGKVAEHIVPDMIKNVIVKAFEHSDKSVTINVGADGAVSVEIVPMEEPLYKGVIFGPDHIEVVKKEKENG